MLDEYFQNNFLDEHIEAGDVAAEIQGRKIWHPNRAIRALQSTNSADALSLAKRIQYCRRGSVCSSLWCPRCRHRAAKGLKTRLKEHLHRAFGDDHEAARQRLVFITPLFGIASVLDAKRVRSVISEARKNLKALNRACDNRLWMQGAFELELLDFKKLMEWKGGNQVKRDTIVAMMEWKGEKLSLYTPLILIHAHMLCDLNGCNLKDVNYWLASRYNKTPRQIHSIGIKAEQTIDDLCWKVGSYPFKDRVQFNMTFESQDYRNGGYFNNFELSKLMLLHDQICRNGVKNLLVGGSGSRLLRTLRLN